MTDYPLLLSPLDVGPVTLRNRVVMLGTDVNDDIANQLCAQLLYLEGEDSNADIWLYINSPGGSVTAGMAIYDTMQFIKPDVSTLCMGMAASGAAILLTVLAYQDGVAAEWVKMFPDPASRPARQIMEVPMEEGVLVQCDFMAVIDR